jgi:hypothetical protein
MAGNIQFTNNASTTLASSILVGATSLTVAAATGSLFPTLAGSQYFYCTLTNTAGTLVEIVKVTARSTDTFTIVRAQDNTTASAWAAGDKVELRVVAADMNNFPQLDSTNTFSQTQTFTTPILGTPTSATLTNATGLPLTTGVTGTLPIANGGTNNAALAVTAGGTVYTDGSKLVNVGAGTSGQVLTSNGASAPTWVAPAASGNSITATASGTVTQGKLVLRQSDGTVIEMTGTNAVVNTTGASLGQGTAGLLSGAINSAGTTFLLLYRHATLSGYAVQAGTISGTTVTLGTAVNIAQATFQNNTLLSQTVTYDVALDRWLISYGTATSGQLGIRVVTVSGTVPTLGTAITLSASTSANITDASYDVASGKHVLVYNAVTTHYPTANVYTISGTTVTAGTPVTIESVVTAPVAATQAGTLKIEYDALSSKNIVLYRQNTLGNLKVNMVTVSGTTVTLGTSVDTSMSVGYGYNNASNTPENIYRNFVVVDSNRSRYIAIAGNAASLTAKEYSLSGANLSFAANLTFSSGSYASSAFYDATSSVLSVVSYTNLYQYKYSSALSNTYYIINTTPSLNGTGTSQSHIFKLATNTLFTLVNNLYWDPNSGCSGGIIADPMKYVICTTATSNLQLGIPIGVPTATYTTGQTANLAYSGSGAIVAGFTGLPVPTSYYYDNTNTLGTSSINNLPTGFSVRALTDTQVVVL